MKQLLLLLLLLPCHLLRAQEERMYDRLESLKRAIKQSTMSDSATVFSSGEKAIKLARELNAPAEEGWIYQYYGAFYYHSNDYRNARKYFQKSIDIADRYKDRKLKNSTRLRLTFMLAETDVFAAEDEFNRLLKEALRYRFFENAIEAYNGLGILYEHRMMDDKAVAYYLKGLRIAEKQKDKYHTGIMLNNLGLLKYENKQFEEARKDLLRGLRLATEEKEYRLLSNLHNNLGLVYRELKDYKSSITHFHGTVDMTRKLGFPFGIGAAYINLGNCYMLDKQYEKAEAYADSAIVIFSGFEELEYLGVAYLLKGAINTHQKQLTEAQRCVDSVLAFHGRKPSLTNLINSYDLRADISKESGDYKKALEYRTRFHEMNDSVEDITNKDKLADLQVMYGKERAESQLSEERTKNKLLDKTRELENTRWIVVLLTSIGVFVLLLAFVYVRYVRKSRSQQRLFSKLLIAQVDEERSRISKDLHDNIGQLLSVIKSKINMFNTGLLPEIKGLEKEVGEVIDQTRVISHELHPSMLEKLGLERSLKSMADQTGLSTGIICNLEIDTLNERFPIAIETQLYRISQECINNTIKHSQASALKIALYRKEGSWLFEYRDNGRGISGSASREGLGMMTIRERVDRIGGKLSLSSEPGKGVQLTVRFR